MVLPDTATQTYFAKLLEQAECYDDMDTYIKELGAMQQEWAVDDRNLTTVTCRSLQQAGQWPHSSEFIAKQVPGAQRGNERTFIRASCGKDDSDSYHMYGGFLPEATCSSRPRAGGACKKNLRKVPPPARSVAAGKASSRCCRGSNFNAEAEAMLPPRHKKTTAALTTASPTAEQLQQELRDEQQAKTAALKEVEQREHQQHEHQGKLEHQQQQQREQHHQSEEHQQQAQAQGLLSRNSTWMKTSQYNDCKAYSCNFLMQQCVVYIGTPFCGHITIPIKMAWHWTSAQTIPRSTYNIDLERCCHCLLKHEWIARMAELL